MDLPLDLSVPARASQVFEMVGDLDDYPAWMPLIADVERLEHGPAWTVLLQAQMDLFTRSKRLRMIRTVYEPPTRAVFERHEIDGRNHAMWRLTSTVTPDGNERCMLRMRLHYGGRLWGGPLLERALNAHIADASERLIAIVSDGSRQRSPSG